MRLSTAIYCQLPHTVQRLATIVASTSSNSLQSDDSLRRFLSLRPESLPVVQDTTYDVQRSTSEPTPLLFAIRRSLPFSSSYHATLDLYSPFLPVHYWDPFPTSQPIQRGSTLAILLAYLRLGLHYPPFIRDYHPLPYSGYRTRYFSFGTMHPTFFRSGLCSLNQLFGFLHTVSLPGFTTL
jgi:hypothetical protein